MRSALAAISFFTAAILPVAATPAQSPDVRPVLSGIDVLVRQDFAPLRGKRVGLVTNQTGVTRDGQATIDVLAAAEGVNLAALFSPEHGIRGKVEAGRKVGDQRDSRPGLPVYSLYGKTREPTAEMLRGLDALIFDLQDIGSRSYTYIATLGRCMSACAKRGLPLYVLDRPNLLGGNRVEGNILEKGFTSFIGPFPIAYCHGLTMGELATLVNRRGWLSGGRKCALTVVRMEGYRRAMNEYGTGLPWVATSPNIPYARTPAFYAATGIVGELPTISIGIGTDRPFELAGAPGLDARKFVAELSRRRLPGFAFEQHRWTPSRGVYAGKRCSGALIRITEPAAAELTRLNFELMDAMRAVAPKHRLFGASKAADRMFDLACGTARPRRLFLKGQGAARIWSEWNRDSARFRPIRQEALLYP